MQRRPKGFTLIELLITTVLFVIVAGIATATFAATARFQFLGKQSQNASAQVQVALQELNGAVERAISNDSEHQPHILSNTLDPFSNNVLVLYSQKPQGDSSISGSGTDNEWRIYCVRDESGAKRLVRYTATNGGHYNSAATQVTCDATALRQIVFTNNWPLEGPDYLTELNVDVNVLHFWTVTYTGVPSAYDPPAIRTELSAVYDPSNTPGVELRYSDQLYGPHPILVRTIANRLDPVIGRTP